MKLSKEIITEKNIDYYKFLLRRLEKDTKLNAKTRKSFKTTLIKKINEFECTCNKHNKFYQIKGCYCKNL